LVSWGQGTDSAGTFPAHPWEQRQNLINWDELQVPQLALDNQLDRPFSEEEIGAAIAELPVEKTPGPDCFTGVFYKSCWDIINLEVVAAFQCIYNQTIDPLPKLNGALITLLPKKEVSHGPSDFRPISLVHSFTKLITKVLALRLAPHMNDLISNAQSAFVKS
jgi:hypothetical protein